ncbi:MAG: STAS domain-containing protein [Pirellulaceae bacterium]
MNVECAQADGYKLVTCKGRLTELTHTPFENEVYPLLDEEGVRMVVDLSGAEWINSEGIAALVRLVTEARSRSCQVVYAAPNAFVDRVLRQMRLDQFLDIALSREEAVARLLASDG